MTAHHSALALPPQYPEPAAGPASAGRWKATAVLCLGLYLLGLDATILSVASPSLERALNAGTAQIQWISDGYALVLGGIVLATGAVTDRIGRRRAFTAGLALCGAAAAAGACADSASGLIASRLVMGAGAALLMPATLSLITNLFPERELRRRGIAAWAAVGAAGTATGPALGGYLVEYSTWRAAFWINVPIALCAILLAYRYVPESRAPRAEPVDFTGALLSALCLLTVVWAVIEAPSRGWSSPAVLTAFVSAALLLTGFAAHQTRSQHPMLPLALLRRPQIGGAAAVLALLMFALLGTFFVLALYLQTILAFSPWQAGLRTLPIPAALIAGAVLATPAIIRFGTRTTMLAGLVVVAAGLAVLATTTVHSTYDRIALFEILTGLGAGLTATAGTEAVMAGVPATHAALGSAINDATRQVGAALGIAVHGSVLSDIYGRRLQHLTTRTPAEPLTHGPGTTLDPLTTYKMAATAPWHARQALQQASRQAFLDGFTATARLSCAVALGLALLLLVFRSRKPPYLHHSRLDGRTAQTR